MSYLYDFDGPYSCKGVYYVAKYILRIRHPDTFKQCYVFRTLKNTKFYMMGDPIDALMGDSAAFMDGLFGIKDWRYSNLQCHRIKSYDIQFIKQGLSETYSPTDVMEIKKFLKLEG